MVMNRKQQKAMFARFGNIKKGDLVTGNRSVCKILTVTKVENRGANKPKGLTLRGFATEKEVRKVRRR